MLSALGELRGNLDQCRVLGPSRRCLGAQELTQGTRELADATDDSPGSSVAELPAGSSKSGSSASKSTAMLEVCGRGEQLAPVLRSGPAGLSKGDVRHWALLLATVLGDDLADCHHLGAHDDGPDILPTTLVVGRRSSRCPDHRIFLPKGDDLLDVPQQPILEKVSQLSLLDVWHSRHPPQKVRGRVLLPSKMQPSSWLMCKLHPQHHPLAPDFEALGPVNIPKRGLDLLEVPAFSRYSNQGRAQRARPL